jgi:hypothetical protein
MCLVNKDFKKNYLFIGSFFDIKPLRCGRHGRYVLRWWRYVDAVTVQGMGRLNSKFETPLFFFFDVIVKKLIKLAFGVCY